MLSRSETASKMAMVIPSQDKGKVSVSVRASVKGSEVE